MLVWIVVPRHDFDVAATEMRCRELIVGDKMLAEV